MNALLKKIGLIRRDRSGVTAIEYGLIAGAISVVIIGAVTLIGERIDTRFDAIATALQEPAPAAPPAQ